jgi:hypothetical protein
VSDRDRADLVLRVSIGVVVVLVAAQTVAQLLDFAVFDLRIAALNSNRHASVFGALSLAANGAAAIAAARWGAWSGPRQAWSAGAALIAAVFALRISDLGSGGAVRFALLLPLVASLLVIVWRLTVDARGNIRAAVRVSLGLLVLSYIAHVVGPAIVTGLGYTGDSWAYQIKGVVKHGCELGGWTLLALALTSLDRGGSAAVSDRASVAPVQG